MPERRIRVLFNCWADAHNVNSQSLSAREIALRLDPERFTSMMFVSWRGQPDRRLIGRDNLELLRVPPRLGSVFIALYLLWGRFDILLYPGLNDRASRLYWPLRRLARPRTVVQSVEVSVEQLLASGRRTSSHALRLARHADLCVAITPAISRSLAEGHGIKARVIPLGVDADFFRPVDRGRRSPPLRVLYVASIQERKQPHLILELARRLRDLPVEFDLIGPTIGDPAYYRDLLREKEREQLDSVSFHGRLDREGLRDWMDRSDLYVLPSRLEGFGKTTLEAAATGLPAVVFSDYETTVVVDGVTGFQVGTFSDMVAAVRRLLADDQLRATFGAAAAQHARQFDWELVSAKWEEVLANLRTERQPG